MVKLTTTEPGEHAPKWSGTTKCDLCGGDCTKIGRYFVDGALGARPDLWALMCEDCYLTQGVSLGADPDAGHQYDARTRMLLPQHRINFRPMAGGGAA